VSEPIVSVRGDRFILRRPSPSETLGGGSVVDPHPKGRHKRFSGPVLKGLEALAQGTPSDVMLEAFNAIGAAPLKEIIVHTNLEADIALQTAVELVTQGLIVQLEKQGHEPNLGEKIDSSKLNLNPGEWVTSRTHWERSASRISLEVKNYHRLYPLRPGIPREELKSRLKGEALFSPKFLNLMLDRLVKSGVLKENGPLISASEFQIKLTPQQEQYVNRLLAHFNQAPFTPPSVKECQAEIGEELFQALIYKNVLKTVSPDVVFKTTDYQEMVSQVRSLIQRNGPITAAQVRDHFNTSRKYALALLEHLDTIGITIRDADARRLPD
jgi:selenocysteine-specific elongation factor